jgi:endonuclease/exonuclease/phosphatase family metal-dependent hydrolase
MFSLLRIPPVPVLVPEDFSNINIERGTELGMVEVFEATRGHPARSFQSRMPMFRLDRIYVRGFEVRHAHVHHGQAWARLSDHAPLSATLILG